MTLIGPLAAACGGDDDKGDGGSKGPASFEFWGWAPGYADSVKAWNASHPEIKVTYREIPPGAKGGYSKMLSAVKSGNAPCLAQVGYESLPSFLSEGAVQDVSAHADKAKSQFTDWSWSQAQFEGKTYAVPVDIGPQAMYYRKDVLAEHKIEVPKTWEEFKAAAQKLKKADPSSSLTSFPTAASSSYWFAGLSWQAGGKWFQTRGDSWKVGLADPATLKVADYWQGLLKEKLVRTDAAFSPEWYKGLGSGKTAIAIGAVWLNTLIQENAAATKGKWAVAPTPQWQAGGKAAGNEGGSPNAVLKGCKFPAQAAEFATWFATDPGSLKNLIEKTGIYPAAKAGQQLPEANKPSEFYGGQNIYEVFKDAAANTDPGWKWGPTMTDSATVIDDAFGRAAAGRTTLGGALQDAQAKTLKSMKDKGINATG
ncbi:extracellular solute-binding protein [Spirillospora sp. CA-294931]|uniref:extracellular solute-binding protein n=1 Tax=Spirillospora sp. CA-294931 TaxID=3240042 RepID=UPI003D8DC312